MNYIIMASGLSTRMGTDKMFISVGGLSLIERTINSIFKVDDLPIINLITNKIVYNRHKEKFNEISKKHKVNIVVNKYDPSTTTNAATMSYILSHGKFEKSNDTIVIDSDLYITSDDLENLINTDTEGLVAYSFSEINKTDDIDGEYLMSSDGWRYSRYTEGTTKYIMRSLYKIDHSFLQVVNRISESENMSMEYFDDYILRCLDGKIPKYVVMKNLREFDNLKDVFSSGLLSLDEVQDLIKKAGLHMDDRGMSNTSFFSDKLFIKILNKDTSSIVDRDREIKTQKIFESYGLAPKTYVFNSDYSVVEAIHGIHPSNSVSHKLAEKILYSITRIHASEISESEIKDKMIDQINKYKDRIQIDLTNVVSKDVMDSVELLISELDNDKPELCHGDLVKENILVDSNHNIKFIDFEYSCIRNRRWDLATLSLELGIAHDARTKQYMVAVDYIWFLWSMMSDKIGKYYDYGLSRLDRCLKNFNN